MTLPPTAEPDIDHVELAEKLHWRLFRIAAALRRQEYDPTSSAPLSLTQCSLLYVLQQSRRSRITDLAAHERVTLPTMTRAIRLLHEQGMVRRERDEFDHRNIWIEITPKGIETQRAAMAELLVGITSNLTSDEVEALHTVLEPLERLAAQTERSGHSERRST